METGSVNGAPPDAGVAKPRYASLHDYFRVLRRYKVLIAILLVLGTGLGLALSATQSKRYEATAGVLIRDISQDLNIIGGSDTVPELPPPARASLSADQVTSPRVARIAADELGEDVSPQSLLNQVSTRVAVQTHVVEIIGHSSDPDRAAEIANAFAAAARGVIPTVAERRLVRAERALGEAIKEARRDNPNSGRAEVLELKRNNLSAAREVAEPVLLTGRAEPPAKPVSPRPVRSATIGAVLGLLIGLIAAFGREALDRRLRNAREVHDELGIPVLGRISEATFLSAGLGRNGVPMLESDFEAFRVLRANLAYSTPDKPPRVVLVTSGRPEEGKSTVSMSLASAAALAGQRTLLVECDLRRPSFARRLKVERSPGLTEYLAGEAEPREILQIVDLTMPLGANGTSAARRVTAPRKLVCIAAGNAAPGAAELLASERFHDFLGKVSKAYDLVVLDAGPLLAVVDPLEIMPHADLVLVCARVQQTTRDEAHAARAALEHLPEKPLGAVVTGIRRGDLDDYYYDY